MTTRRVLRPGVDDPLRAHTRYSIMLGPAWMEPRDGRTQNPIETPTLTASGEPGVMLLLLCA
jgi:hypothetical protein